MRGFFAIGVVHGKSSVNVGTLWRSAHAFGAAFLFTIGRRYRRQAADTTQAFLHVPLYNYETLDDLCTHLPLGCQLVGVELDPRAEILGRFTHPARTCYLLGAEDHGLPEEYRLRCHRLVAVPGGSACLNVATAGSIVIFDRWQQQRATGAQQPEKQNGGAVAGSVAVN